MRTLPAGPTAVDMVANSAFLIGLAEGLRPQISQLLPGLPFQTAEYNFYRAAQFGLDAKLVWPQRQQYGPKPQPILPILEQVLPVAEQGLANIGVAQTEIRHYLGIIEKRIASRQTSSAWQLSKLERLGYEMGQRETLHQMLEVFMALSEENIPVAEWAI